MKLLPFLALSLALAFALRATPSDPVGALRLKFLGNSDTVVSLPLQRPALAESAVASRSGNDLTLTDAAPSLPAGGAYLLVMSGVLEGATLPITAAAGHTVTVDATGVALSSIAAADLVAIAPFWTLDTLFPAGTGVLATTNPLQRKTELLLFDDSVAGKNLSASATYFYYSGAALVGPGWYRVGDTQHLAGATRLAPRGWFIVRHNAATDTFLTLAGGVQLAGWRVPLFTRAAATDQDNYVALPVPTPVSLGASGLATVFRATTNPLQRGDELLVFDNAVAAKNKSAAATYYFYSGTGLAGSGWYRVGDTTNKMDALALRPGEGAIVRRKSTTTPDTRDWTGLPGYLQ